MLTLVRKEGQGVWIGEVYVEAFKVIDGKVWLGVTGPKEVPVLRGEIRRRPVPRPKRPLANFVHRKRQQAEAA